MFFKLLCINIIRFSKQKQKMGIIWLELIAVVVVDNQNLLLLKSISLQTS